MSVWELSATSRSEKSEVTNAQVSAADVLNLPKCDVVLCQLEVPIAAVSAAADRASETGALMAINLAPAQEVPTELLRKSDLLIVNEVEAAFYGDVLHQTGGLVALTLGGAGAALYKMGKEVARAPAFSVPVADTTGAGDTFCGALAVALAEGTAPDAALRFASAAAALAVTKPGAQPSLPKRAQVEALLADA